MATLIKIDQSDESKIKPGWNEAQIVSVKCDFGVETPFGIKDIVTLKIKTSTGEFSKKLNYSTYEKSYYSIICTELLDGRNDVSPEELIGIKCKIKIKFQESKNGKRYPNIVEVLKFNAEIPQEVESVDETPLEGVL